MPPDDVLAAKSMLSNWGKIVNVSWKASNTKKVDHANQDFPAEIESLKRANGVLLNEVCSVKQQLAMQLACHKLVFESHSRLMTFLSNLYRGQDFDVSHVDNTSNKYFAMNGGSRNVSPDSSPNTSDVVAFAAESIS